MANILVGVTGSVSLYKALNVLRQLEKEGHSVRVILTPSAEKFVSITLFKALIQGDVFTEEDFWHRGKSLHIELARWADLVAIIPCTANTLSKIRYGIADNLLLSTLLAFKGRVLVAPAMHEEMWHNPELQGTVQYLKNQRNVYFSGPGRGPLASGEVGCGRLLEEEYIVEDIKAVLHGLPLKGVKILVSYGRTEEPLDPVRVITNRSSGLMGIALCKKVKEYGGDLVQVVGETSYPPYGRGEVHRVRTTDEMYEKIREIVPQIRVLIMAAAVSDYKPSSYIPGKEKKQEELTITLSRTVDILKEVAREKRHDQIFVGFALETGNLEEYAEEKLLAKNLDFIVGNYADAMGSKTTSGVIMDRLGNVEKFENLTKEELAEKVIKKVIQML